MIKFRIHIALILAALLVVTSQTMAVARGMVVDAQGVMILCTGQGHTVVFHDADGAPIEAPHLCPDCVLSLLDTPLTSVNVAVDPATPQRDARRFHAARAPSIAAPTAQARDPPRG